MMKKNYSSESLKQEDYREISEIIESVTKEFGEGVITTLERDKIEDRKILSSGSFILDKIIGGGYVFGKIIEIYGEASSGKTTLALHAAEICQKSGGAVAYIDLENSLDVNYAKRIGVETKKLLITYPRNGEEALDLVVKFIKEKVKLIVVDSVAALTPKAELEGDLDRQTIGSQARMMSFGLRKINSALTNSDSIVIFINQIRNKISTSFFSGTSETTTGGKALPYFASLRIRLKEKEKIEKDGRYVGIRVQAQVKKNKLASPYQESTLEIIFSKGIEKEREIVDVCVEKGIFEKNGSWYSFEGKKIGNGKENVVLYLKDKTDFFNEVLDKIR